MKYKQPFIDLNRDLRCPIYGLPDAVVNAINEVADARQVPREFAIAPALLAISWAAGSEWKVTDFYDNTLNVFVGIVAPSGSNKSQPLKDLLEPLSRKHAQAMDQYRVERAAAELANQARGRGSAPVAVPKQPKERVFLDDATPEARFGIYQACPHGVVWKSEELSKMFGHLGRYSSTGDTSGETAELLSIYDGDALTKDRVGVGAEFVEHPWLSLYGTIQPKLLFPTFGKFPERIDSGLVPRFMWFFESERKFVSLEFARKPSGDIMKRWSDLVLSLYEKGIKLSGNDCRGAEDRMWTSIHLHPEARNAYIHFGNWCGNSSDPDSYESTIKGKLRICAYKLAGLATVSRWAAEGCKMEAPTVQPKEMCWAIDVCHYLLATHMRLYALCLKDPKEKQAKAPATKGSTLSSLYELFPDLNSSKLAEALGVDKSNLLRSKRIKS